MNGLTMIVFFEFFHPDRAYRFASAYSDIDFNGETYSASGELISIGDVTEEEGLRLQRLPVTLSLKGSQQGDDVVNSTYLQDLRDERIRGSIVNIDIGFYDTSGALVNSEPLWRGQINSITMSPANASVTFDIVSARGFTRRREQYNFSDAHHQEIHAGDRAFEFQVTNFLNVVEVNSGGSGSGGGSGLGGFSDGRSFSGSFIR